ncbi:hypothetical protein FA95DRAFT_985243 [Auriscalpium vulgare]|uniref:Uncharacterized protein n=1 Tax=Auriscalpium vulgare TaxID=40419 RepID=A0ACB8RXG7_9AGAM|nr:hypothetical protein FA95DRAFT_985243 [Auriscalpium vulgare]
MRVLVRTRAGADATIAIADVPWPAWASGAGPEDTRRIGRREEPRLGHSRRSSRKGGEGRFGSAGSGAGRGARTYATEACVRRFERCVECCESRLSAVGAAERAGYVTLGGAIGAAPECIHCSAQLTTRRAADQGGEIRSTEQQQQRSRTWDASGIRKPARSTEQHFASQSCLRRSAGL